MMTEFNPILLFASIIIGFLASFAYTMWIEKNRQPEPIEDSLQPGFSYTFGYACFGGLFGATYGMALAFMFYPILFITVFGGGLYLLSEYYWNKS